MRSLFLTCSLVAAFGLPVSAFAQLNSGSGGGRTGSTGSTGFGGSSGFGSSGFGTAGSSGFGGSGGFGSSGFGQGGMGSGGMGSGGMGGMGQGGMGMNGMGGQQQGGNFLGVNNNQNQFLGRANTGQQGGMGQNGMNQFGNTNRGGNRGNNLNTMNSMLGTNGLNSGMNNRQQQVIRPRQKVAFDYPVPKTDTLHVNLKSQLAKISVRNPGMSNVLLSVEPNGELVLRGAVRSEADAKLAVNLVRLEPGVRSVRNELTFPPTVE